MGLAETNGSLLQSLWLHNLWADMPKLEIKPVSTVIQWQKTMLQDVFWFSVQMRMKQTIIQPTTYQTLLFVEAGKLLQIFINLFHCHLVIQLGQNWSPVIKESSKTTLNAAWYSLHQHNNSMQYWCKRVRKNQYLARHDKTGCQWQH